MASLKFKVSFTASMLETMGLVKFGRFYVQDLALSSWWGIFAAKLAVSGRMDLVADMNTDTKRAIRPNAFGMPFYFLSLS